MSTLSIYILFMKHDRWPSHAPFDTLLGAIHITALLLLLVHISICNATDLINSEIGWFYLSSMTRRIGSNRRLAIHTLQDSRFSQRCCWRFSFYAMWPCRWGYSSWRFERSLSSSGSRWQHYHRSTRPQLLDQCHFHPITLSSSIQEEYAGAILILPSLSIQTVPTVFPPLRKIITVHSKWTIRLSPYFNNSSTSEYLLILQRTYNTLTYIVR
jgi:hypothetical protein